MNTDVLNTVVVTLVFLALFASAELLYHIYTIKAEITRKYVHIATGLITMLFPTLINNHWLVLLLCSSFLILLSLSIPLKLLPSINAVQRRTNGSLLYPIVVYGCYYCSEIYNVSNLYYIPILILALCDPIAALVGKSSKNNKKYKTFGYNKTWIGSFVFLAFSFIICFLFHLKIDVLGLDKIMLISTIVATITTIAEAVSHRGYDNLTIPISASVTLIFFNQYYNLI